MKVASVRINGVTIAPGSTHRLAIAIARLPSHTLIDLPIYVYRAKKPGPHLLLTAGIHGDEINGVASLRQLISEKALMPECGMVVAIPLVNVYGFIQNSRYLPDGKDLNRSFPGGKTGSLARQIAHILMTEIIPAIDFGIDFHTGGNQLSNYPHVRAVMSESTNRDLSMAMGAPFVANSEFIDKSLRKEAWKRGRNILVFEGGESQRIDPLTVEEGTQCVKRLMQHLGMKSFGLLERQSTVLTNLTWLRAKISGVFLNKVGLGQSVMKGQVIGAVVDPYGETAWQIKSTQKGYLIGINHAAVVNAGDALYHIGI